MFVTKFIRLKLSGCKLMWNAAFVNLWLIYPKILCCVLKCYTTHKTHDDDNNYKEDKRDEFHAADSSFN